jgi:TetR/AcrR family transcriptional regulator, transcriptional repressor for nem operon
LRYSKGRKQKTYDRILETASVQLKKSGSNGVGIANLMREAGLTHGGFYSHFRSRDDLVNKAFGVAMDQTIYRWRKLSGHLPATDGLEAIVRWYLSAKHRDNPGEGCALPAFAAEMGRGSKAARKSFAIKLEEMIKFVAADLTDLPAGEARQLAISAISIMMGAITLARASAGQKLSTEILEAGAKSLKLRKATIPVAESLVAPFHGKTC